MNDLDSSIVRRLMAAVLAVGLLTGIIGVLLLQTIERRQARADLVDRTLADAEAIAATIDGRASALSSQLRLLGANPIVAELDEAARAELAIALRAIQVLDSLALYGADGDAVAAVSASRLLRVEDLAARDDLAIVAETDVAPTELLQEPDLPALEFRTTVQDPPGTDVGTLVAVVPVLLLAPEVNAGVDGPSARASVVADDGTTLAHRELDQVLEGRRYPLDDLLAGDRTAGLIEVDGARIIAAAAPLREVPGWVVAQHPDADAATLRAAATRGITLVFLAVIAAIVTAISIAGRRMLQPLRPLARAVEQLGSGDTTVRTDVEGVGEVGVLARGFNEMAERLERRRRALESAEQEARENEERLRLMVEGVRDHAILLLDARGVIITWNTGAGRLLGRGADRGVGAHLSSFFDPTDPPPDPFAEPPRHETVEVEGWWRRGDDDRFWGHITLSALRDEDGYAAILQDRTELRSAQAATEEALHREREAAAELRRTNELKDEFLAIATHEIRTPLSAIVGAGQMLVADWEHLDDEQRRDLADIVDRHAQDMGFIVDRLLDFTRLQAGRVRVNLVTVPLRDEIERHVELLGPQLDEHAVVVEAEDVTIQTDRALLRHVVTNLLSNAGKFSPSGSTISIDARVEDDELTIVVSDEGVGIAPEEQDLIFELFRRSSSDSAAEVRGTGVGLAIVRRYVELAEGRISVESSPGEGSTFVVTLPVLPE